MTVLCYNHKVQKDIGKKSEHMWRFTENKKTKQSHFFKWKEFKRNSNPNFNLVCTALYGINFPEQSLKIMVWGWVGGGT